MFLYELALHLGVRSTDLVAYARQLGMDVGPSSYLTPEQVQYLASAVAPPPAPPPPPSPSPEGTDGAGPVPPEPGPTQVPPGGKRFSPGVAALVIAGPVARLLAAFVFFFVGEDADATDDTGSNAALVDTTTGEAEDDDAPSGGSDIVDVDDPVGQIDDPPELGADSGIVDLERFCSAWLTEFDFGPEYGSEAERRATVDAMNAEVNAVLDEVEASTSGELARSVDGVRVALTEMIAVSESLPVDENDWTAEQEQLAMDAAMQFGRSAAILERASDRYCE